MKGEAIAYVILFVLISIIGGFFLAGWLDCHERGGTYVKSFPAPYTCIGGK